MASPAGPGLDERSTARRPAGALCSLLRPDGSVVVPPALAGEVLRSLVRDLDARVRANGGHPSPEGRRLLWALHDAAQRAEDDQSAPGRPNRPPGGLALAGAAPGTGFGAETPGATAGSVELGMREVAARLGCSLQWARRLARSGRIRARRAGPVWLVDAADLDHYRHGGHTS